MSDIEYMLVDVHHTEKAVSSGFADLKKFSTFKCLALHVRQRPLGNGISQS